MLLPRLVHGASSPALPDQLFQKARKILMRAASIFNPSASHPTISLSFERGRSPNASECRGSGGWIDRQRLAAPCFLKHFRQMRLFTGDINDPFRNKSLKKRSNGGSAQAVAVAAEFRAIQEERNVEHGTHCANHKSSGFATLLTQVGDQLS